MRRLSATAAGLVAALALAPPLHAANPQIAGIQVALRAHGLYLGPIDGIAGPMTRGAVKRFQQREGLAVDGLAGPRTRAALGPLGRPLLGRRMLTPGTFGLDVAVLQFLLTRKGLYDGALDGYYGPETVKALLAYQRRARLGADGIVGPRTLASFRRSAGVPVRAPAAAALSPSPRTVRALIDAWAGRYGIEARLARALAWMESGYQTNLTSTAGAWGVMQIIPSTWEFAEQALIGRRIPRTAEGNIRVGVAYLHHLLHRFKGDERLALAAWYQGERAVRKHGPYAETKRFVANVLALKPRV